tara:strand:- start:277 stop:864 length:588 start_codon:yes stop_codon:yes gene_type:complete
MEKLLETLTKSCEGLKAKGIITSDEYTKCIGVGQDENREKYSDEENKDYLNNVYGSTSDKINLEENTKYENYQTLFKTNMDSLIRAQQTNNKQLEFKFTNNLNTIKDEIKEQINTYELNIKNTKSHEVYKVMLLKNRTLTELIQKISVQKNEMLSVQKKHSNIDEKLLLFQNYRKIWGLLFLILVLVALYIGLRI